MIRCAECRGTNVEIAMWVDPNTQVTSGDAGGATTVEVIDDFGEWKELDTKWCRDCKKHTALIDTNVEGLPWA